MFLYLVTCFLRATVLLQCRLKAESKIHVPIYPYLTIVKGDEIVRPCDRRSNGIATLRKHVTKCKHMWKWMVDFFRMPENRGIKITLVNSIRITKSIYVNFVRRFGSVSNNRPSAVHNGLVYCYKHLTDNFDHKTITITVE